MKIAAIFLYTFVSLTLAAEWPAITTSPKCYLRFSEKSFQFQCPTFQIMACHTKITFTNGYTGLHENAEVESQCMAVNKCLELGRQNVEACKTAEEQAIEGTVCNYCCFTDGCNNDPYVIERIERGLA